MMIEPQELTYCETEDEGPAIAVHFPDQKSPISLSVKKVIETAFNALKSSSEAFQRRPVIVPLLSASST